MSRSIFTSLPPRIGIRNQENEVSHEITGRYYGVLNTSVICVLLTRLGVYSHILSQTLMISSIIQSID